MTNDMAVEDNRPPLFILYLVITIFCLLLAVRGHSDLYQAPAENTGCGSDNLNIEKHSYFTFFLTIDIVAYCKHEIGFSPKVNFEKICYEKYYIQKCLVAFFNRSYEYVYAVFHLRKIRSVVLRN